MRKLLVAALVLGMMAVLKTPSFALFTSMGVSTSPAMASLSGTSQITITANMFDAGGATTTLTWSSITVGTTKWKASDSWIVLHSTITDATGGVQIYTDNKGTGASPVYTGIANPCGLVSMSTTTKVIPLAWRCVATSTGVSAGAAMTIIQGTDNKLYQTELAGQTGSYPVFLWMEDKNTPAGYQTPAYTNSADYVTIRDPLRGIQHAEATWAGGIGSPVYLYFAGNFTDAIVPDTVKTTTLRIEAFHD